MAFDFSMAKHKHVLGHDDVECHTASSARPSTWLQPACLGPDVIAWWEPHGVDTSDGCSCRLALAEVLEWPPQKLQSRPTHP